MLPDSYLYTAEGYAAFPGNFHYNPGGALSQGPQVCPGTSCGYVDAVNQNIGAVKTNGIDIALGYKANAGAMGRFNFELQSTWVHSYKYQLFEGGEYIENVGNFSPGNGGPQFRWQHNLNIDWNLAPFSLGFAAHYKSGYVDIPIDGQDPTRKVSAYATEDLYATYAMSKGFTFTVGVKNLADRLPPYTQYTGLFQQGYDPRFTDPTGRAYYARATYSF